MPTVIIYNYYVLIINNSIHNIVAVPYSRGMTNEEYGEYQL